MKKVRLGFLVAFLCSVMLLLTSENVHAKANDKYDDPEYWRAQGNVSEGFYDSIMLMSDDDLSTASARPNSTVRFGVDVSKYQGNINWAQAKANGVEFALIRVGYRGYSTGALAEDPNYKRNIEGALAQGIPVGVYMFSQAVTEAEAVEEANYVLSRISQYNITLPVIIDYEYAGNGTEGRLYSAYLSRGQATAICKAFCKRVEEAGYIGMVYANKSMLTNDLNGQELAADYGIWLAQYASNATYAGDYDIWQYSSEGDGAKYGMSSQYVDLNYWYDDGSLHSTRYNGVDYSAVFNPVYYADKYKDLKNAFGYDSKALLQHFVTSGMREGRQAIATFNVQSYKNRYADLRNAFGADLPSYYVHYMNSGQKEGRVGTGFESQLVGAVTSYGGVDYSAVYDYSYYISKNKDVYKAYGNDDVAVLAHFVNNGMAEGRQAISTFSVASYKNRYADLRRAFGSDLKSYYLHYLNYGKKEGRVGTGFESNLVGAITTYGGVDYAAVYDYSYYIANNGDVYKAYGNDDVAVLEHFVNYGMSEGHQAISTFNVNSYKNLYSDLRRIYGSDLKSYYLHYMNYGKNERRIGTGYESTLVGATTIYEGVDYSSIYDFNYYTTNNRDVYKAYGNDENAVLAHFVNFGMKEGRQGSEAFNVRIYKNNYADLRAAFGDELQAYYVHYLNCGKAEGRVATEDENAVVATFSLRDIRESILEDEMEVETEIEVEVETEIETEVEDVTEPEIETEVETETEIDEETEVETDIKGETGTESE